MAVFILPRFITCPRLSVSSARNEHFPNSGVTSLSLSSVRSYHRRGKGFLTVFQTTTISSKYTRADFHLADDSILLVDI